mmetsp:Transcript_29875/g.102889  ORF Transcript_29875/g.102889 Transcript_29875/m.102889 type:complete len:241 (+) Transcript_29875:866-1588(+)
MSASSCVVNVSIFVAAAADTAWNSAGASIFAVENAHAIFDSSEASNRSIFRVASAASDACRSASAATASNNNRAATPAFAKAQAMFAKAFGGNAGSLVIAAISIAAKSAASDACAPPAVANAHARSPSSFGVNVSIFFNASAANASKSCGAGTTALAKAQASLARSLGSKGTIGSSSSCGTFVSLKCDSAAMASNKSGAATPAFAKAHAVKARSRAANSLMSFFFETLSKNSGAEMPTVA